MNIQVNQVRLIPGDRYPVIAGIPLEGHILWDFTLHQSYASRIKRTIFQTGQHFPGTLKSFNGRDGPGFRQTALVL